MAEKRSNDAKKAAPHKPQGTKGGTTRNPPGKATPGAKAAQNLEHGPSHAHQKANQKAEQKPQDAVEEESMESFPASDAPPYTRSTD